MGKTFNMTGGSGGSGGGGISLSSIAITTPPTKTAYQVGDTFDAAGMVVTATYTNGATLAVGGYTVSPATFSYGDTAATITYTEGGVSKTATQAVTVSKVTPTITTNPSSVTLDADHLTAEVSLSSPSGGAFSASSSDTSVATVSVSGNTLTVSSVNDTTGTATITVTQAATSEYESAAATVSVTAAFSRLPAGYTEREYIVFSGSYIDADYTPVEGKKITCVVKASGSSYRYLFGMADYRKTPLPIYRAGINAESNSVSANFGDTAWFLAVPAAVLTDNAATIVFNDDLTPKTLDVNNGAYSANATTNGSFVYPTADDIPIYIGAWHYYYQGSWYNEGPFSGNYYSFTVQDSNGDYEVQCIPATRDSDSAVGFYDVARRRFLTAASGSGALTAGPAV